MGFFRDPLVNPSFLCLINKDGRVDLLYYKLKSSLLFLYFFIEEFDSFFVSLRTLVSS